MINIELETEINDYVLKMKNAIKWDKLPTKYNDYLLNRFIDCNNAKESFYRIKFGYETLPLCPICNKKHIQFTGVRKMPFNKTCGDEICAKTLRRQTTVNRNMKLYGKPGHTNIGKCKETKMKRYGDPFYSNYAKAKQTCLEKYGVEYVFQSKEVQDKSRKTCMERYGVENGGGSKQSLEKIKTTCQRKYGVDCSWKIKDVIEKSKLTKLERYGDENFSNPEKTKETCLRKYGVTNIFKTKEAQEKYKNTCLERYGVDHNWKIPGEHLLTCTPEALEKKKQTSLKNWGVESPSQSDEVKRKKRITRQKNKKNSEYMTEEDKIYNELVSVYPSVIREYGIDERYPHSCDFYIPELDMFIEYNGFPTHGLHPYNKDSKEDANYVEKLKNWAFVHYDYETFTRRDPQKRLDAKINNLNFIELWNFKEAMEFIYKLRESTN